MKKDNKTPLALIVLSAFFLLSACGTGEGEGAGEGGYNASHNFGQNCLSCHYSGGPGETAFHAAGSLYKSDRATAYTGGAANIKLYTNDNQTGLLRTITADASGNFYTQYAINFSSGLYPVITNTSTGKVRKMSGSITYGGCNAGGCHDGSSQARLTPE